MAQLNLIQAKLEGDIDGDIQLVRGLVADVAIEPNITQARFAEYCAKLLQTHSQIRNVAAAPGLVVSLEYPLAGNEAAIGLDYRKNAKQREAALRARDTGDVVMAGPLDLVQGGKAFIVRFPVFSGGSATIRPFGASFPRLSTSTPCSATAALPDAICRSTSRSSARTAPAFSVRRKSSPTPPSSPT